MSLPKKRCKRKSESDDSITKIEVEDEIIKIEPPTLPEFCSVNEPNEVKTEDELFSSSDDESKSSSDSECSSIVEVFSSDDDSEDEGQVIDQGHLDIDKSSGDETATVDNEENNWLNITNKLPNFNEFPKKYSINVPNTLKTPNEIYRLFLTDEIINKMVIETNKYAEACIKSKQQSIKLKSRLNAWKKTTPDEMENFIGILLAMSLNKIPYINDYWSKKKLYRNEFICTAMPRDRFLLLIKFWRFGCSNYTDEELHKIRPIYDMIVERFKSVLTPGKYLVVHESIIPWRGTLNFTQYIQNKSTKHCIKIFKICSREGYTSNVLITGKGDNRGKDVGKVVVLKLVSELENEGRIVIADEFYNSVSLAEELALRKTFLCGMLKFNTSGLPNDVTSSKLDKGQIIGKMNSKGVRVIQWRGKRPILMISTCKNHDTKLLNVGKGRHSNSENVKKPQCMITYNNAIRSIDNSEQMNSFTPLKRGLKWYRKVIMELLLEIALVNAWIVYNTSNNQRMSKKDFTEVIIEALTKKPAKVEEQRVNEASHSIQKSEKSRRCGGCYGNLRKTLNSREATKKVKKVKTYCPQCEKHFCLKCYFVSHQQTSVYSD